MTITIGTSGGNKTPTITIGTSSGNKTVSEGWIGTSGGNKQFFSSTGIVSTITLSDANLSSISAGDASASVTFSSDGYATGVAGFGDFSDTWATPPATNIGVDYEIYCAFSGDTPFGAARNSWLSLSSGRSWALSSTSGEKSTTLTITIRDAATQTVQDSATYILVVQA